MEAPSLKGELRDLIARYLELYYVSESCKDGIRTENRYQSISLGELESAGVRSTRAGILDQIDFSGRKVLDLGSNLGELSRGARARGASLVDGFEYDPFFVELASALSAYGQVTRVSYHKRDITDAAAYGQQYDVVLAFSVFVYVEPVLERIASVTDQLFVLETHRLEGDNLVDYYVRVLGRHFPHYAILGESDWDVRLGGEGDRRAVLAFARDEATLLRGLHERDGAPPNVFRAASAHKPGVDEPPRLIDLDLTTPPRESLHARFLMFFRFEAMDELIDAIDRMEVDVEALARGKELRNLGSEGWAYWFLFTKGYLQYVKAGEVREGNVYLDYLVRHFIEHGHDAALGPDLVDREMAVERVMRRYRDFDELRRLAVESPDPPPGTQPVRITLADRPREPPLRLYEVGSDELLPVKYVDGWHRLCSARLSGMRSYPCEALPENLHNRPIRAEVERFGFEGDRLVASGWFFHPEHLVNYELRLGRPVLARGVPLERPDVAEAFPHFPHSLYSGFEIDVPCSPPGAPARFDLVVAHEIFPIGLVPLIHLPEGSGAELGFEAPSAVYQLLRPLARRIGLDGLDAVVEIAEAGAQLRSALRRVLPGASITSIEPGALDSGAARETADLAILHAVLPTVAPGAQRGLLESVHGLVRSGGHVALSVQGELIRALLEPGARDALEKVGAAEVGAADGPTLQTRAHTVAECADLFEVLDYVEGGVANRYDLVLLRKP